MKAEVWEAEERAKESGSSFPGPSAVRNSESTEYAYHNSNNHRKLVMHDTSDFSCYPSDESKDKQIPGAFWIPTLVDVASSRPMRDIVKKKKIVDDSWSCPDAFFKMHDMKLYQALLF